MLKKIFILFFFIFSTTITTFSYAKKPSAYFAQNHITCAKQLQDVLAIIEELPEGKDLIQRVLKDGSISIKPNQKYSKKFDGYWEGSRRTIHLTASDRNTLIGTLIFEMHNAIRDKDFEELDKKAYRGKISKKDYVEAIEYIEYENALSTKNILKKGIAKDIFPSSSYWNIPNNFSEHFAIQKSAGHSARIAKDFDRLAWN